MLPPYFQSGKIFPYPIIIILLILQWLGKAGFSEENSRNKNYYIADLYRSFGKDTPFRVLTIIYNILYTTIKIFINSSEIQVIV
jgi:hypothetical protein